MSEIESSADDSSEAEEQKPKPAPRRGPGHRGQDVRDTMAEMAAKAHEISLEAGSRMTSTMREVIGAAAGLTPFAVESARDLVQYMVRRAQMSQDEADKLMREVEAAHATSPRPLIKVEASKAEAPKKAPPPPPLTSPVLPPPPPVVALEVESAIAPRPVLNVAPEPLSEAEVASLSDPPATADDGAKRGGKGTTAKPAPAKSAPTKAGASKPAKSATTPVTKAPTNASTKAPAKSSAKPSAKPSAKAASKPAAKKPVRKATIPKKK